MSPFALLRLDHAGPVATVTLHRPDVHNAFNAAMVAELTGCFEALAVDPNVRMVLLTGAGRSFCAGADIHWMRESLGWSYDENLEDAGRLAAMYETIDRLPKPVIARVNGAAFGGGAGLLACCDLVIAADHATFSFTEVKLGLVPAVIGRFVIPKIGASQTRALFVTGARFDAERAAAIGLVHHVVAADALDAAVQAAVDDMLAAGPSAVAAVKSLIAAMDTLPAHQRRAYTVAAIAAARTGDEGQAGLTAFLEKTRPPWRPK